MFDEIALHIENMERMSHAGEFEEAQYILRKIKNEINSPDENTFTFEKFEKLLKNERESITIKETYKLILSNAIRLNPDAYPFTKLLKLTLDVHKRLIKIRNPYLCSNTDKVRRIVAEEMLNNQMTIQPSYRGIKPNRAFLDIALTVNPSLCKGEIERREKVKLWKSVETGDKKKIELTKKGLREVREKE